MLNGSFDSTYPKTFFSCEAKGCDYNLSLAKIKGSSSAVQRVDSVVANFALIIKDKPFAK